MIKYIFYIKHNLLRMKKSEHIFYKNVMHFQIKSTEGANSLIIPKKYAHLMKKK